MYDRAMGQSKSSPNSTDQSTQCNCAQRQSVPRQLVIIRGIPPSVALPYFGIIPPKTYYTLEQQQQTQPTIPQSTSTNIYVSFEKTKATNASSAIENLSKEEETKNVVRYQRPIPQGYRVSLFTGKPLGRTGPPPLPPKSAHLPILTGPPPLPPKSSHLPILTGPPPLPPKSSHSSIPIRRMRRGAILKRRRRRH
ncbi:hypothetical protein ACOME3_007389 [Neoechinorhynchus agilis]